MEIGEQTNGDKIQKPRVAVRALDRINGLNCDGKDGNFVIHLDDEKIQKFFGFAEHPEYTENLQTIKKKRNIFKYSPNWNVFDDVDINSCSVDALIFFLGLFKSYRGYLPHMYINKRSLVTPMRCLCCLKKIITNVTIPII
uniref:Uncharacterized protein n=1 Tax=Romanomermis culicivorax TaxID=13658 RepID=A0A915HVC4_ROMCU